MKPKKTKSKKNTIPHGSISAGITSLRRLGKNTYLLIPPSFVDYLNIGKKEKMFLVPTNGVIQICDATPRLTIPILHEAHSFEPLPSNS